MLVANLTPAAVTAEIGLIPGDAVSVRLLDETTAGEALCNPRAYRASVESVLQHGGQMVSLDLAPFAMARLDARPKR